ncbi:Ubiquitin-activating enzyme E1, Cys active site [Phytophthora cactorum]|nr:Ubiquitin-activating enzyme E1, Cys active site [Phytophthora cactorum]
MRLLGHRTAFPAETSTVALGEFDADAAQDTLAFLQDECRVLIIGAGGLGCELLKDVVLSGFTKVDIIDMDTIDVSNLNRQFLFRAADVASPRPNVQQHLSALAWPRRTRKGTGHGRGLLPPVPRDPLGLDNIEARRYLNSLVVSLAEVDEDGEWTHPPSFRLSTAAPKACVVRRVITSCFECSLETFPPQKSFPMCTIAETPRQPAHCIAYAFIVLWPREFPEKKLDKDSPEHMQWVYQAAKDRAEQFGIAGVTYSLTLGVVKNIIPAVASTNAVVRPCV